MTTAINNWDNLMSPDDRYHVIIGGFHDYIASGTGFNNWGAYVRDYMEKKCDMDKDSPSRLVGCMIARAENWKRKEGR